MSSLIEQAAQRLEQLRRAGIEVPGHDGAQVVGGTAPAAGSKAATPRGSEASETPAMSSRCVELDLAMLQATGIVTPNAPRSHIADEFRASMRSAGRASRP